MRCFASLAPSFQCNLHDLFSFLFAKLIHVSSRCNEQKKKKKTNLCSCWKRCVAHLCIASIIHSIRTFYAHRLPFLLFCRWCLARLLFCCFFLFAFRVKWVTTRVWIMDDSMTHIKKYAHGTLHISVLSMHGQMHGTEEQKDNTRQ